MTQPRMAVAMGGLVFLAAVSAAAAQEPATQSAWLTTVARQAQSASAPTSAPTSEPAAACPCWPPGLMMDALNLVGAKSVMDAIGVRTWGFVEAGFTGRLTGGQDPLPGRLLDARRVNNLRLNQLVGVVERPYDSKKDFDIGARGDALYGGDAMFTHPLGLNELGEGDGENWFDPIQFYVQVWLKSGADSGLEFTVGRFFSPIGYEATYAPNSPLYSHSYLFDTVAPFTTTGVQMKYIFNAQWSAYFAIVNGWDDFTDNNHAHSYVMGGAWNSLAQIDGHSRDLFNFNVMTGPEQPGNVTDYLTVVDGVFTHWWTGKLSQTLEADYDTQEHASNSGSVARWYGVAHYLSYIFDDRFTGIWRAEWFRDDTGIRMGTAAASWYEMTWGVNVTPFPGDKILQNLVFRPEFRWDFADKPVFGGDRENQLTLGMDAIFKF